MPISVSSPGTSHLREMVTVRIMFLRKRM